MPRAPVPAEIDEFLRQPHPAVMTTLRPDGTMHAAATWYDWEDGRALLNVAETRRRLRWMQPGAPVVLTIVGKDNWYQTVTLSGKFGSLAEDQGLADIDRLSQRYRGQPYPVRDQKRFSGWMDVESWHAWNAGKPWGGTKG